MELQRQVLDSVVSEEMRGDPKLNIGLTPTSRLETGEAGRGSELAATGA